MINVLRAEWAKFRTLPSSFWLTGAVAVLTVGMGAAIVGSVDVGMCPSPTTCDEDTTKLSLSGVWGGQMAVAILAILAVTAEYGAGTMSATLVAMPRRARVFTAKAIVVVTVTCAAAALAVVVSLAIGRHVLADNGFTAANGYAQLSLSDGPTLRAAVGTVVYLGLIALLGLGLGTVIRDTAVSLTVVMSLLFVVPMAIEFVSDPEWYERLQQLAPTTAGLAVQSTTRLDELAISPWPGLGVLAVYAVAAAVVGCVALVVRDDQPV